MTDRGALVFRSVTSDDAGRYSCTPHSQLGEGRPSVPVQLIVKGIIRDLLSRSYVCRCVWSVITADNFTPAERGESFSSMFAESAVISVVIVHVMNTLQHGV